MQKGEPPFSSSSEPAVELLDHPVGHQTSHLISESTNQDAEKESSTYLWQTLAPQALPAALCLDMASYPVQTHLCTDKFLNVSQRVVLHTCTSWVTHPL